MNATGTELNLSCIKLMTYGMIKILLSMQKHFQKLLGLTKHTESLKKKKKGIIIFIFLFGIQINKEKGIKCYKIPEIGYSIITKHYQ